MGWNDILGAPKLQASAASFSLGRKGDYFAAKSGGKLRGPMAESTTSDDPNSTCRLAPQH
jgi:hypothetical protein